MLERIYSDVIFTVSAFLTNWDGGRQKIFDHCELASRGVFRVALFSHVTCSIRIN